jgi:hypothetical protein
VLTTRNSRDIEQNVSSSDVNANVASDKPVARAVLSPEAAIFFNKGIVARPLMTPEVCSIHVKNLEYRYRWVNKSGRNGAIYMQRRAQGFTNATLDDVDVLGGDATATSAEINAGDLILMKIQANVYDAAIKYNMEKAMLLSRARGMYLKNTSSDVNSDVVAERETIDVNKMGAFIPSAGEIEKKLDASMKSGSASEARKSIDEIRERQAKAVTKERIEE